jgi:hypothetical protein
MYQHILLQIPPKFTQIGLKLCHLATLRLTAAPLRQKTLEAGARKSQSEGEKKKNGGGQKKI